MGVHYTPVKYDILSVELYVKEPLNLVHSKVARTAPCSLRWPSRGWINIRNAAWNSGLNWGARVKEHYQLEESVNGKEIVLKQAIHHFSAKAHLAKLVFPVSVNVFSLYFTPASYLHGHNLLTIWTWH